MHETTRALINEITALGQRSFGEARALPAAAYTSPDIHRLELDRIFNTEWVCLGHVSQLRSPGDFFATSLLSTPIIVTKDRTGQIRVLANTCVHRGAVLLEGCGTIERITCPYHAWSYDLDGSLIGAPYMNDQPRDRLADCRLPPLAHEVWRGWIYASLDFLAPPLEPRLRGFDDIVAPYRTTDMTFLFHLDEEWPVNWKILAENFMESYHVFCVHPQTVAQSTKTSGVRCWPGGDGYTYHTLKIERGPADVVCFDQSLPEALAKTEILGCIFPSHLVSVTTRMAITLSLQPMAVDRLRASAHVIASPDYIDSTGLSVDEIAQQTRESFDTFNEEDKEVTSRVARGIASKAYRPGPLSSLERPLWEFQRYLAARLAS